VFGGKTPEFGAEEFSAMGYKLILYANAALQASIAGMQHVLGSLRQTGSLAQVRDHLAGFAERQRVVRTPDYDALRLRYEKEAGA